jgi:flagellar hook assembly protein FlgD
MRGRLVRSFEDSVTTAGARKVTWDGRDSMGKDAPAGVYLVTLEVAGRSVSNRVSLVR